MSTVPLPLRQAIEARARNRCEYCLLPTYSQAGTFPVDHILPQSRGGETGLENLALSCPHCNDHKWAHVDGVDPETAETVSLFNPRRDRWSDHFRFSADEPMALEGLSPRGRATLERLQMNHPEIVAMRQFLARAGVEFEPSSER